MDILVFSLKTWKLFGLIDNKDEINSNKLLNIICQTLLYAGVPLYFLSCCWFFVDVYVYRNEMDIQRFLYIVMQAIGALCYLGTLIDFLNNKKILKNVFDEIRFIIDSSK